MSTDLNELVAEGLELLKKTRKARKVLKHHARISTHAKKNPALRFKGAMVSRFGDHDENPVDFNTANVLLDGGARVVGNGVFVEGKGLAKGRFEVRTFVRKPRVDSRAVGEVIHLFEKGKISEVQKDAMFASIEHQATQVREVLIEDRKTVRGEYLDHTGPSGNNYISSGRGPQAGTDRPDYRSPLVRRGCAATEEDGWRRSARQVHDHRNYGGAKDHLK
jgi:hypothetical protein